MEKQTKNITFQYLKALLIIMVIDDHTGSRIGILNNIFPYNSFYMPLFVFCSGFFYRRRSVREDIIHRIKKLMLPYLMWSLAGDLIALALSSLNIVNWFEPLTIQNIRALLFFGPISQINGAGWFALMLFQCVIIYNLVKNTLPDSKKVDYWLLLFCVIIGMAAVKNCMSGRNTTVEITAFYRTLFYVQFYHIGYMMHKYWQDHLSKVLDDKTKVYLCGIFVICGVMLISYLGSTVDFPSTASMASFKTWYLPIITTIIGGGFWYLVSNMLYIKMGGHKWIDYLADNTYSIMMTHLFWANIPTILGLQLGLIELTGAFDAEQFKINPWYRYDFYPGPLNFFISLMGSIVSIWLVNKLIYAFKYIRKAKVIF